MAYEALKGCNASIDVTILRHVHTCVSKFPVLATPVPTYDVAVVQ